MTDFSAGKFVKEIFSGHVYRILLWDKNTDTYDHKITMHREYKHGGVILTIGFDNHRLDYYGEYFPNVEKPRYWVEPGEEPGLLLQYIFRPSFYFFVDIWRKLRPKKKTDWVKDWSAKF